MSEAAGGECPICRGFGWVRNPDLYPGNPGFGELGECPCKLPTRRRCAAWDEEFGVKLWLGEKDFAGWRAGPRKGQQRRRAALAAAKHYAAKHDNRWLLLMGIKGSGKSHLAAAIVNEVRAKGEAACFVNAVRLIDWFKRTLQDNDGRRLTFSDALEQIKRVPVLALDDLSAARETDWTREVLYSLLNDRYDWRLATVITTDADPEGFDPRLASRLADRALVTTVNCGDVDFRRLAVEERGNE